MFEVGTDTRVPVRESRTLHMRVSVYLMPTFFFVLLF